VANAKSLKKGEHEITVRSTETDNEDLFFDKGFTISVETDGDEPPPVPTVPTPPVPTVPTPPVPTETTPPVPTETTTDNDSDDDNIENDVEGSAPNNGDGNEDGTPDSQQPYVVSLRMDNGQDYLTLAAQDENCYFSQVQVANEEVVSLVDTIYDFPHGLVSFALSCNATEVKLYYHGVMSYTDWTYRQYDSPAQQWHSLDDVSFEQIVQSGQIVTVATIPLTNNDGDIVHLGGVGTVDTIPVISQIQFGSNNEFVLDEYATSSTILSGSEVSGYLINIPVTRTFSSDGIVTVNYNINAIPSYDYIAIHPAQNSTLTWADGDDNEQQISLFVVDAEKLNFRLVLTNPSDNAKLGALTQATITKTVIKDEPPTSTPTPVCSNDPEFSLTPAEQQLILNIWDESIEFEIAGGQNINEQDKIYIAESPDSEIVTLDSTFPSAGGAKLTFTPKAAGTTQVIVKDCASETVINITVEGCDPNHTVTTKPAEVTLLLGDEAPFLLRITSDDERIKSEILEDSRYDNIVNVEPSFTKDGDMSFLLLTPVATGETTLTVGDACGAKTEVPIKVIDCLDDLTIPLQVEAGKVALEIESDPVFLKVTGRQCNLNLNHTEDAATGTLFSSGEGEKLLKIVPKQIGQTEFVISDDYGNEVSVNVNVTVNDGDDDDSADIIVKENLCCVGMDKDGNEFPVNALFGEMSTFGVQGDTISLGVDFTPDAKHVGKKGSLIIVMYHHQTEKFFVADESTLQPWDGQLANLVSTMEFEKLPTSIMKTITLQLGSLPYPIVGEVSVYVAYYVYEEEIYVVNTLAPLAGLIPNSMGIKVPNENTPSLGGQQYESFNPTAHFAGGVTTDAGQTGNYLTIGQIEAVTTALNVKVDEAHEGQTANLHIVAAHSSTEQQFMYDGTTWQPVSDIAKPAVVESYPRLPSNLTITQPLNLVALPINSLVGQLILWVGYSIVDYDNNTLIIFNGKAPLQLNVVNGKGIARDGKAISTSTHFELKLLDGVTNLSGNIPEVAQDNAAAIDFTIDVDPADVGQAATLILVAQLPNNKFFLLNGNKWQPWQSDINGLITTATKSYEKLPSTLKDSHSLTLEALPVETLPAEVFIYVGYLLGNADFIHSFDAPLHFKMVEANNDNDVWCFACR
jgi:hypothetical protein